MKRINQTLCLAFIATAFVACNKNKDADSPNDVGDDSMEEAGEDVDEAADDSEDSLQEAEEDLEEAADEVEDEVDGDPTTD